MKGFCFECENFENIENHHVVPRVLGGTKTVPLCIKCHGLVHDRDFIKSRNLQKAGIQKAKESGKYKGNGRTVGTLETIEDFIKKPKVRQICLYRSRNIYSYRDISTALNVSASTVQKVYKIISDKLCDKISKEEELKIKEQSLTTEFLCKRDIQVIKYQNKINKLINN